MEWSIDWDSSGRCHYLVRAQVRLVENRPEENQPLALVTELWSDGIMTGEEAQITPDRIIELMTDLKTAIAKHGAVPKQ